MRLLSYLSLLFKVPTEATVGIEPTYKGFADPCLTTWLRGHTLKISERDPDSIYYKQYLGASGQTLALHLATRPIFQNSIALLNFFQSRLSRFFSRNLDFFGFQLRHLDFLKKNFFHLCGVFRSAVDFKINFWKFPGF